MKTVQTLLLAATVLCGLHIGKKLWRAGAIAMLFLTLKASATVCYVNVNGAAPAPPYTNWLTAATNIQDAIDAANPNDQILVTNGVYQNGGRVVYGSLTNRVAVTKSLIVRSVNGPAVTVIQGYQVPGTTNGDSAIRCVYLTNGAALVGFTLTNGATSGNGGGLCCESINAFASNCVVQGNNSASLGGGTYQGTLNNCIVRGNTAFMGGGAFNGTLNNCVLINNSASYVGGGAENGILNNCTIVGNSAPSGGSGTDYSYLNNSIIYYNQGGLPGEETYNSISTNCCTETYSWFFHGNSFTNAPLFVDLAGGDLRLQSNSPCINSGDNAFAPNGTDLDGNPRIVGGTVDVGAYEFQTPALLISYVWLQQFGLPTFGFNITGAGNMVVVVEACTNLSNPVWQPVQTNTLTGGMSYFSDPQWTNYPGRFYRLCSP